MVEINLERYPKIRQRKKYGCIPVNIENTLKYYGEKKYDEIKLLRIFKRKGIDPSFKILPPILDQIIDDFEFIFRGAEDFNHNIVNVIEYIKSNIDEKTPILVSFKVIDPKEGEKAHIKTAIAYNDSEISFFDPGDGNIIRYNYESNEFSENIKGDYHTLVIKKV